MPTAAELYDEADQLKEQGKLAEAVTKLQEALDADANYALAHAALAVHLQKLGQHQEAVEHAQKVCALVPDDPFSYTALSVIYQRVFAATQNHEFIRLAEEAMERSRIVQMQQGQP